MKVILDRYLIATCGSPITVSAASRMRQRQLTKLTWRDYKTDMPEKYE